MTNTRTIARGRSAPWLAPPIAPANPAPADSLSRDDLATVSAVPTGELAAWRLSRILGQGRWTQIYQARPKSLRAEGPADYTLKTLRSEFAEHAVAAASLRREAQVARDVSHAHLNSVLSEQTSASERFLVMPYLEGATLRQILDRSSPARAVGECTALWIARQIGEALVALHAKQWLHSDIKPANILVAAQGHATLLDLGFARRIGSDECSAGTAVQGSLRYVAPEALVPTEVLAAASDVYSLGAVLFEALTGRLPFEYERPNELAAAHLREEPPRLRSLVPHASRELDQLVRGMLAKTPLRRPTAEEVVSQLVELEIAALG